MPVYIAVMALGAAFIWAIASMLAHRPAQQLGAFAFTFIQVVLCFLVLALIVSVLGGWSSVQWSFWQSFLISSFAGLFIGNLALIECIKCGGPRRTQLLFALSAPFTAVLGFLVLNETLTNRHLIGGAICLTGVLVAIIFAKNRGRTNRFETVHGSLARVAFFGLIAAVCHAIGLIALKPAMQAGTDPLAASAIRLGLGIPMLAAIAIFSQKHRHSLRDISGKLMLQTFIPGFLGYVIASSLLLMAIRTHDTGIVVLLSATSPIMILPILWIKTREAPHPVAWAGAILVVAGVGTLI